MKWKFATRRFAARKFATRRFAGTDSGPQVGTEVAVSDTLRWRVVAQSTSRYNVTLADEGDPHD